MTDVRDLDSGVALRFLRSWDDARDQDVTVFDVDAIQHHHPRYVGRLTDEGWYPARVCSGRELLTC